MLTAPIYRPSAADIEGLVEAWPFALLISNADGQPIATPLPLLLEKAPAGALSLLGHFGRANPQIAALQAAPRALVVFQGPHGYISPSWLRDRTQAPTWNFMIAQMDVVVRFDDAPGAAIEAVDRLSAAMEAGRPRAWSPIEMGERHERLAGGVIAFRADVVGIDAKFKLGQNERGDVFADILRGLDETGQPLLRAAMAAASLPRSASAATPAG
jgi:transcriptional regulator